MGDLLKAIRAKGFRESTPVYVVGASEEQYRLVDVNGLAGCVLNIEELPYHPHSA